MSPAPWEQERYREVMLKRHRDRKEQEKGTEAQAKRQKKEIEDDPKSDEVPETFLPLGMFVMRYCRLLVASLSSNVKPRKLAWYTAEDLSLLV